MIRRGRNRLRELLQWYRNWLGSQLFHVAGVALDMISPPICLVCHSKLVASQEQPPLICGNCQTVCKEPQPSICKRCALPRPLVYDNHNREILLRCAHCSAAGFRFQRTFVLGAYRGPLRQIVLMTKQAAAMPLCFSMGHVLGRRIQRICSDEDGWEGRFDLVCPVPMHWRRRWLRRFNSADVIARAVANVLNCPLNLRLLHCKHLAQKQGMLTASERVENVKHCYGFHERQVRRNRGKRVLLVDDVMTSGATLNELSRLLLSQGVSTVSVAVLARGGYGNLSALRNR